MNNTKIWAKVIERLSESLSQAAIKTWFSQCEIASVEASGAQNITTVSCANNFCLEQIKARYLKEVERAFEIVTDKKQQIILKISSTAKKQQSLGAGPLFTSAVKATVGKNNGEGLNLNHSFLNFVVGKSNNLAYAAAKAVAGLPGKGYNPLFIYGGVGVGKTHLIQAVGNEILDKLPGTKIVYTTCERFTNEFIESLISHRFSEFRAKYRKTDVLLIDDVQFLSGKESTQEEFFHTFNELHVAQKQIVLTSDRHPTEIGKLEDRLVSRFLGGLTADIGQPDFEMRVAILQSKCAGRGIKLEDAVIDFLATRVISNARELEGALIKLLSAATALGKDLSIDLAKEVFVKEVGGKLKKVGSKQVIAVAAKYFNLRPADLTGPKRQAVLVRSRQVVMYLLRVELGLPLVEVGRVLGGRDHTTIIYGVEKVSNEIANNTSLKKELVAIKQALL